MEAGGARVGGLRRGACRKYILLRVNTPTYSPTDTGGAGAATGVDTTIWPLPTTWQTGQSSCARSLL